MVGIISENAGILILPESETGNDVFLDLIRQEKCDPVESQYLYSSAQDWKKIEGKDTKDLLEKAAQAYWIARTVSLFRIAIAGLEESLEKRVLEEVEDNLTSRNLHKDVLGQLLIAPLKDPKLPYMLASSAIKYGCATVEALLDDLMDLQP